MVYIVADPGSTWNGKKKYAEELIKIAKDCGCSAVKFQLFDRTFEKDGNISMSIELWRELYQYGQKIQMEVAASVFYSGALEAVFGKPVAFVKFAYSQRKNANWIQAALNIGKKVVVSSDPMHVHDLPNHPHLIRLYVKTTAGVPDYPVQEWVHFEGRFPPFQGFSDHTTGWKQAAEAVEYGATWLEKHITLPYSDITCPDSRFALKPKELEEYVRMIRA